MEGCYVRCIFIKKVMRASFCDRGVFPNCTIVDMWVVYTYQELFVSLLVVKPFAMMSMVYLLLCEGPVLFVSGEAVHRGGAWLIT